MRVRPTITASSYNLAKRKLVVADLVSRLYKHLTWKGLV